MSASGSTTSTQRFGFMRRASGWSASPPHPSAPRSPGSVPARSQLHLTESRVEQPSRGHLALEVDDFGAVYRWAADHRGAHTCCRRHGRLRASRRGVSDVPPRSGRQRRRGLPSGCRSVARADRRAGSLADLYAQNADARQGDAVPRPLSATWSVREQRQLHSIGGADTGVTAAPGRGDGGGFLLGTGGDEPLRGRLAVRDLERESHRPRHATARFDLVDGRRLRLVEQLESRPAGIEQDDAATFRAPVGDLREPEGIAIDRAPRRSPAPSGPLAAPLPRSYWLKRPVLESDSRSSQSRRPSSSRYSRVR